MANVAHSTLTGADLHEPKGAAAAASGQVYIANGSGSGAWGSISTALNFTGMIADFVTPIAPTGWLELDGSAISRTTYADLFAVQTIQQSGTRTSGSAVITGLSSTSHMKVGYYVGGSGITNGTTVLTVDSSTQITLSANASSSGTSTVIVSPWALGDGSTTFTLPNTKTSGRFRRSRTSSVEMGVSQADQNQTHTHTGTTGTESANHSHSGTTDFGGVDHTHAGISNSVVFGYNIQSGSGAALNSTSTGTASAYLHQHTFSTGTQSAAHTHSFTSNASGGTETRPLTLVVMTCVKY